MGNGVQRPPPYLNVTFMVSYLQFPRSEGEKLLQSKDLIYTVRRPGRPRKSEEKCVGAAAQEMEQGRSLRFEMRLPPALVADLEVMREITGGTFANYIRQAILRALAEDKEAWSES